MPDDFRHFGNFQKTVNCLVFHLPLHQKKVNADHGMARWMDGFFPKNR